MKQDTVMQNGDENKYKYVFVCGLQRSGTSMLGRNIARLENCTGFKNTGVLQDEGQYLQDVYPPDRAYGGTGRYGFDPRAHLTGTSDLLTPENVARLRASWHAYWDSSKTICVEKTPGNLIMTRFLQAAFPNSYFVILQRHPVAVSLATQRWKVSLTAIHRLFEHWLQCYGIFEEDKKYLKRVYHLKYEDYIKNPGKYHQEIAAFIGTRVPEPPKEDSFRYVTQWPNPMGLRVPERTMEEVTATHNEKYFDRWHRLLTKSPSKVYYRYVAQKYESRFAKYGYSLVTGLGVDRQLLRGGKISMVLGRFGCLAADARALMQRFNARTPSYIKGKVKAMLPEFLIVKIRRAGQRASLDQNKADPATPKSNAEVSWPAK
jgi:Sulfotransferase family